MIIETYYPGDLINQYTNGWTGIVIAHNNVHDRYYISVIFNSSISTSYILGSSIRFLWLSAQSLKMNYKKVC